MSTPDLMQLMPSTYKQNKLANIGLSAFVVTGALVVVEGVAVVVVVAWVGGGAVVAGHGPWLATWRPGPPLLCASQTACTNQQLGRFLMNNYYYLEAINALNIYKRLKVCQPQGHKNCIIKYVLIVGYLVYFYTI